MSFYSCPKCQSPDILPLQRIGEYCCSGCCRTFVILEIDRENLDYGDLLQAVVDSNEAGIVLDPHLWKEVRLSDQGPVATPEMQKLFDEVLGTSDKGVSP